MENKKVDHEALPQLKLVTSPTTENSNEARPKTNSNSEQVPVDIFERVQRALNNQNPKAGGNREYPCRFCPKKFRSPQAVGGHQNAHRRERAMLRIQNSYPYPPPFVGYNNMIRALGINIHAPSPHLSSYNLSLAHAGPKNISSHDINNNRNSGSSTTTTTTNNSPVLFSNLHRNYLTKNPIENANIIHHGNWAQTIGATRKPNSQSAITHHGNCAPHQTNTNAARVVPFLNGAHTIGSTVHHVKWAQSRPNVNAAIVPYGNGAHSVGSTAQPNAQNGDWAQNRPNMNAAAIVPYENWAHMGGSTVQPNAQNGSALHYNWANLWPMTNADMVPDGNMVGSTVQPVHAAVVPNGNWAHINGSTVNPNINSASFRYGTWAEIDGPTDKPNASAAIVPHEDGAHVDGSRDGTSANQEEVLDLTLRL